MLFITPKKEKALAALLTCPTKSAAAAQAGIGERTLRTYLSEPEFMDAYKKAFGRLVTDATRRAQQSLTPAISALRDIVEDKTENSQVRVSAARSILEYGLKLTETLDIVTRLEELERWREQDAD